MRSVVVICLCATMASAGPREVAEAARRVEQGNKHYQDGRYEDALRLYQAAYDLAPSADTLFNIGLAHEKLADHERCALSFRRYIAEGTDDAAKQRAKERQARCVERARVPVKISSIPSGGAISLAEGAAAATFRGRTPSQLELAPATYRIKVEMPGYVAMEQTVVVDVGARPEVDFPLEKLSSLGIEADPAGATVELDDSPPEPTPFRRELRAGTHKVRLRKAGYRDAVRDVAIAAGEQATLVLTLQALPSVRELALTKGVDVKVDGQPVTGSIRIEAGDHRIEASAPGALPFAGTITIPEARGTRLDVQLEPLRSRVEVVAIWTLAGVSLASLAGGTIYGAMALGAQGDYDRMPSVELADRGESYARRSDVLFAVAVIAAVAAGTTWRLTRPGASRVEVR
jgi:hypothetical protein